MAVNADVVGIVEQLRATVAGVMDRQTRQLVAAWAAAWEDLAGEFDAAALDLTAAAAGGRVTRAAALRSERLAAALGMAADALQDLAGQTSTVVAGDLPQLAAVSVQAHAAMVTAQLPPGVTAGSFPRAALDAIVTRTLEQVTALTVPLSGDGATAMRRELIRGMAVGANPRDTAARMVARARGRFDGGLGRALTIARTEQHDALRAASLAQRVAAPDAVTGWVWAAQLGSRTCPACWSMHGTVHPPGEPGPLGHQNCRCAAVPVTPSWRDLGFDDVDEPESTFPDADAAFRALPPVEQRAVLGPGRHREWAAGRFPMDDWVVRRSTPGWRDSYVPAPAPAGAAARLAS